MLLHQEEKKSEGCHLMVQWSERKLKGENVLQGEEGENESGDVLLQNLTPPLAYPVPNGQTGCTDSCSTCLPPPLAANIFTPFTASCFPYPWGSSRSFYVNPQFGPGATFAAGQFPLC